MPTAPAAVRLFCLLLLLSVASSVHAQDAQTITLDEAVRIALERNVTLRQAANNVEGQAAQVTAERGDFLPNLNFSLTPTQRYGTSFDLQAAQFTNEQTQGLSGTISSSVNLFNGFGDVASLRQARHTLDERERSFERGRQTVVFNVVSAYLDVISNRELIAIREENVRSQEQQLAQTREFVRVGARPISEQYQLEAGVAQAEFQLLEAERQLQLSQTRLIQILQLDPFGAYVFATPEADVPEGATAPIPELPGLLRTAFERRADLEAQAAAIDAAESGVKAARAGYWPSVSLQAFVNGDYSSTTEDAFGIGLTDQLFDDRRSQLLRLSVDVPLFNRFQVRNSVQQAEVRRANAQLQLEGLRQDVALQVRQAYLDYQTAIKNLDVTEKQFIAAERALQAAQERYDVGAATQIELAQVRADYVQAASNRVSARYNYLFQEKLLAYYTGTLDPADTLVD